MNIESIFTTGKTSQYFWDYVIIMRVWWLIDCCASPLAHWVPRGPLEPNPKITWAEAYVCADFLFFAMNEKKKQEKS